MPFSEQPQDAEVGYGARSRDCTYPLYVFSRGITPRTAPALSGGPYLPTHTGGPGAHWGSRECSEHQFTLATLRELSDTHFTNVSTF